MYSESACSSAFPGCSAIYHARPRVATAKLEEAENVRYFGAAYHAHMEHTKMIVTLVF